MSEDQATEPVAAPSGTLEAADQALDAGAAAEAVRPAVQEVPRPPEAALQASTDAETPQAVIKRVMAQAAASDARADEIEAENDVLKKANHELKVENLKADGVIKGMRKQMNEMMPDTTLHGSIDDLKA